jgi:hypothetical protein
MNKFLILVLALLALSTMAFKIRQGPPSGTQGPPSGEAPEDHEPTEEEQAYFEEHEEEILAALADAQAEAEDQAAAAGFRVQTGVGSVNYH